MVEVECTTARPGGVTLVGVQLDNRVDAPGVAAHRVRLRSRLDGPVWPPRVEGVPAGPWDDDGAIGGDVDGDGRSGTDGAARERSSAHQHAATVEVVVPTGRVGSVGFASPAEPVEPPVEVVAVEPADERADVDPSAEDVLRVLGDPSPPRDAVAAPEPRDRA